MTPLNERKRGINFVFDSFNLHHSCCHSPPPPPSFSSSPHPFIYCFKSFVSCLPAGMTLKRILVDDDEAYRWDLFLGDENVSSFKETKKKGTHYLHI